MQPLATIVDPVKPELLRAGSFATAASLLWILQAAVIANGFSLLLAGHNEWRSFAVTAALFAIVGTVKAVLDNIAARLAFNAADQLIGDQRKRLLATEAFRSIHNAEQTGAATTASLIAEKTATLQPYLLRYWPARVRVMIVPLVLLMVIFPISWVVGILLLVAGPLIPVFMALVGYAAKEASERQLHDLATLNSLLIDRLSAIVDIRLLNASEHAINQFQLSADSLRERTMNVLKIAFLSSTVLDFFSAIGVAMVAVYVGFALLGEISFGAYSTPLTTFEGLFILLLAPEFFQPLRDLAGAWHDKAAAEAVADELTAVVPGDTILGNGQAAQRLPEPVSIVTESLRYETSGGQLLQFPDLQLVAGNSLALTGPSGAGKSTLLSLIAGLASPLAGQVTVSGERLTSANADAWRAGVGWVSQTPHFLTGSLRSNLSLGGDSDDFDNLSRALTIASASDIVDNLPNGLQSQLSATGIGVSGGEARRLTLARAAFSKPDVILADEPTADLDRETANHVTSALISLAQAGAILIVATHDATLAARMQQQLALTRPQGRHDHTLPLT